MWGVKTTFSRASSARVHSWLVFEDVKARGGERAVREGVGEGRFVDARAAGGVHEDGAGLHPGEASAR